MVRTHFNNFLMQIALCCLLTGSLVLLLACSLTYLCIPSFDRQSTGWPIHQLHCSGQSNGKHISWQQKVFIEVDTVIPRQLLTRCPTVKNVLSFPIFFYFLSAVPYLVLSLSLCPLPIPLPWVLWHKILFSLRSISSLLPFMLSCLLGGFTEVGQESTTSTQPPALRNIKMQQ